VYFYLHVLAGYPLKAFYFRFYKVKYGNCAGNNSEKNSYCILPNPNALVAIGKGMWVVKLYSNRILQFLTQVILYNGNKKVVVS